MAKKKKIKQRKPKQVKKFDYDEKRLVKFVMTGYNQDVSADWWQSKLDEWEANQSQYEADTEEKAFPWPDCSNVRPPVTETVVDNISARISGALIGVYPWFTMIPQNDFAAENKAVNEKFMNKVLHDDVKIELVTYNISHFSSLHGLSILKAYPVPVKLGKRKMKVATDIVALEHLVYPEDTKNFETAERLTHVVFLRPDDLKRRKQAGVYKNVDVILENFNKAYKDWKSKSKGEKRSILDNNIGTVSAKGFDAAKDKTALEKLDDMENLEMGKIKMLEQVVSYDINGDGFLERLIVTVDPNSKKLARVSYLKDLYPNEIGPYFEIPYKPIGRLHGRGLAKSLSHIDGELTSIHNQTIDSATIEIAPYFFFDPATGFDPNEVEVYPGRGIPIEGGGSGVQFPRTNANSLLGLTLEKSLWQYIERLTSISDPQVGVIGTTRKTAQEVQLVLSEGNIKHENYIKIIQYYFSRYLLCVYNLYAKFNTPGLMMRITGEKGEYLDPDYDFVLLGTLTGANKRIEQASLMSFYQILNADPLTNNPNPAAIKARFNLLHKLGESLELRNLDDILPEALMWQFNINGQIIADQEMFSQEQVSAEEENSLMQRGGEISVHPNDNHTEHLELHGGFIDPIDIFTDAQLVENHIREHLSLIQNAGVVNESRQAVRPV